jgi:hypothetical protein
MATTVKNVNGTSQTNCVCGSWLRHWEKFSGQTTRYCGERSCIGTDLVGAHVQRAEGSDGSWYIVPLCQKHNKSAAPLEVILPLVPANKKQTCERR